jgi:hypothetical protein
VVTLAALAAPVRADSTGMGHFPYVEAGFTGGFSMIPIPITSVTVTGTGETHDSFSGIAGPTLQVHLDARKFLFNAIGTYNLVGDDLEWTGRAEIVLAAGLGFRTKHNLIKSINRTSDGSTVTTTTEYYVNKHVPMVIGLSAGVAMTRVNAVSFTTFRTSGDVTFAREAAFVPAIDVGFTVQSPQLAFTIAPLFVPTTSSFGFRWAYGMSFPISSVTMFFRLAGDHILGDDPLDNSGRALGMAVVGTLGIGTSMGVR